MLGILMYHTNSRKSAVVVVVVVVFVFVVVVVVVFAFPWFFLGKTAVSLCFGRIWRDFAWFS